MTPASLRSIQSLHKALGATLQVSGLVHLAKRLDEHKDNILRVLIYHRVADRAGFRRGDPNQISASPGDFAKQMSYLARRYRPIGGEQVVEALQTGTRLPPQAVLVTFDDGYRDFLTHAWPILCAQRIPAVLFVSTAFPGSERHFWWDIVHDTIAHTTRGSVGIPGLGSVGLRTSRQRSLVTERLVNHLTRRPPREIEEVVGQLQAQLGTPPADPAPVLTWDELRQLSREGLTVASHTRRHPALPTLTREEIAEEIEGAGADLRRELGSAPPLFAYPFGQSDPRALPVLQANGIVASFTAFTREPVANIAHQSNPFLLRREAVNGSGTFIEFCLSLTSLYNNLQSSRRVQSLRRRLRRWATAPVEHQPTDFS
jgi:peptidoglycan/xylan/chitin deacetylase (PgdA/CDA1 family)